MPSPLRLPGHGFFLADPPPSAPIAESLATVRHNLACARVEIAYLRHALGNAAEALLDPHEPSRLLAHDKAFAVLDGVE